MDYNEKIFKELEAVNVSRETKAKIERNVLAVKLTIGDTCHNFTTAKLAKIFLENYLISDNLKVDRIASGIVSQNNDEAPVKRRGIPKKADNDGTPTV